jgi:hypothetical protein
LPDAVDPVVPEAEVTPTPTSAWKLTALGVGPIVGSACFARKYLRSRGRKPLTPPQQNRPSELPPEIAAQGTRPQANVSMLAMPEGKQSLVF